ncbi:MAG: ABC transporter ATP-binding protein [bacterium]|nr:ABC transporter ATP-binding protein [bacterium]
MKGNGVIVARDVCKYYRMGTNEVRALDHVTVEIGAGEFVALMGPSGSGKTTLMNIIAGIDNPTSGRVCVAGAELQEMSEAERSAWRTRTIGYVFQNFNLVPVLTAEENVELPLLLLPLSRAERRAHVEAALESVNMLAWRRHYPRQLSGGQEQRVAIARAIVTDPAVLVADEPTGNLDAEAEREVMELLVQLNRQLGTTVVMVTHDATAASYAGRIIRLEKGRIRG